MSAPTKYAHTQSQITPGHTHKCVHTARGQTQPNGSTHVQSVRLKQTNVQLYGHNAQHPGTPHIVPLCTPSVQVSYLRRAAADGSDLVTERRHRDEQLVVLVEDAAAGGLVQTQQALTAQHVQGET